MNQTRALPVVLEILDDGLRLYRRNLASFMVVATAVLVVIALLTLSFLAFVQTQIGTTAGWSFLAFCILLLFGYPLVLYAFAALSRTTVAMLDGQPLPLTTALRIGPRRGCGMVVFNIMFCIGAGVCMAIFSSVISCPITYGSLLLTVFAASLGDTGGLLSIGLTLPFSLLWSMTMFSGWLASSVYALQAFVLEQRTWTESAARVLDSVTTRFGRSLLMFIGAGAIFGTLTVSYLGSLLALLGFVQSNLDLTISPLATQVIILVVTVASLVVLLPPLAIWMTMFYRRSVLERDGAEITSRISAWREQLPHH